MFSERKRTTTYQERVGNGVVIRAYARQAKQTDHDCSPVRFTERFDYRQVFVRARCFSASPRSTNLGTKSERGGGTRTRARQKLCSVRREQRKKKRNGWCIDRQERIVVEKSERRRNREPIDHRPRPAYVGHLAIYSPASAKLVAASLSRG